MEFTVTTKYFCQWEYGAKEYFDTEDEATKKATDTQDLKTIENT